MNQDGGEHAHDYQFERVEQIVWETDFLHSFYEVDDGLKAAQGQSEQKAAGEKAGYGQFFLWNQGEKKHFDGLFYQSVKNDCGNHQ